MTALPWWLREVARGAAHLMDFAGVLGPRIPPGRSVEQDMADTWADVLAVIKPAPEIGRSDGGDGR